MPGESTPTITHVCLSDLHLGEEDSLLTDVSPTYEALPSHETRDSAASNSPARAQINPLIPSPVMKSLVECMRKVIDAHNHGGPKPTLVLNGDTLEFALARVNEASMVFRSFLQLIMSPHDPMFKQIVFVPGNHDHHIWEMGREEQYLQHIKDFDIASRLPEPYHTTPLVAPRANGGEFPVNALLSTLARQAAGGSGVDIRLAYPNFAVVGSSGARKRMIVFHHGHFIEPLYKAMSVLRTILFPNRHEPSSIYELEGENFAWIDFFWSALGRSGGVGDDVEAAYERMNDPAALEKLIETAAQGIADEIDVPGVPGEYLESKVIAYALKKLAGNQGGLERHRAGEALPHPAVPLSKDAAAGLHLYLHYYLRKQIKEEQHSVDDLTFVFGHTHKPFSRLMRISRASIERVAIYNTGGWVVEREIPDTAHGAGIVFVDNRCNVANVRLFQEGTSKAPHVEEAAFEQDENNPLHESIREMIGEGTSDVWKKFSREAHRAINVRSENLRDRILDLRGAGG